MIPYQEHSSRSWLFHLWEVLSALYFGCLCFSEVRKKEGCGKGMERKEGDMEGRGGGNQSLTNMDSKPPACKVYTTEELLTSQRTQEGKKREKSSLWCSKKIYTHFDPAHFSSTRLLSHHSPLHVMFPARPLKYRKDPCTCFRTDIQKLNS